MVNITFTLPDGSSNHGNPNLLCIPPSWSDYLLFFFSNYVAHAATVITFPGQGRIETVFVILSALFLPGSGIMRALRAIRARSGFEPDLLRRAARAGALCMVVPKLAARTSRDARAADLEQDLLQVPRPLSGASQEALSNSAGTPPEGPGTGTVPVRDATRKPDIEEKEAQERPWWDPVRPPRVSHDAVIHGQFRVPPGYKLVFVPRWASHEIRSPAGSDQCHLASSYNLPKLLVGLVQAVWAVATLYRARGDQIQRYGYAAFGLTVAPYAFMSIMNILGTLLNPEYAAVFLVRTPWMSDAEADGGFFAAEVCFEPVGDTTQAAHPPRRSRTAHRESAVDEVLLSVLALFCGCIPLAVIGGLSKFQAQGSSDFAQVFTMAWVAVGIVVGVILGLWRAQWRQRLEVRHAILLPIAYGLAALGGMVQVGLMIRDYGVCTLLS